MELHQALREIQSLNVGDRGVIDVVTCGPAAIPELRRLLFTREPSGLFEMRCRVVDALAALDGFDVLREYLERHRDPADPVERLGDDAVINATARALSKTRRDSDFELFVGLARRRLLPGLTAGLAAFNRTEAIPLLVAALAEDECRPIAEAALERMGSDAYGPLDDLLHRSGMEQNLDSPSRRRQLRSARKLLKRRGGSSRLGTA